MKNKIIMGNKTFYSSFQVRCKWLAVMILWSSLIICPILYRTKVNNVKGDKVLIKDVITLEKDINIHHIEGSVKLLAQHPEIGLIKFINLHDYPKLKPGDEFIIPTNINFDVINCNDSYALIDKFLMAEIIILIFCIPFGPDLYKWIYK